MQFLALIIVFTSYSGVVLSEQSPLSFTPYSSNYNSIQQPNYEVHLSKESLTSKEVSSSKEEYAYNTHSHEEEAIIPPPIPLPVVNRPLQVSLLAVILTIAVLANGSVILNISRDSLKLRMVHFLLIRHVCITDCLGALLVLPIPLIAVAKGNWDFGPEMCSIVSTTTASCWTMHLLAVAFYRADRVLAVWLPTGRYPIFSVKVANILLVVVWCLAISGSYGATHIFGHTFQPALALCIPNVPLIFFVVVFAGYCIGLIGLTTGYVLAFARRRRRRRREKATNSNTQHPPFEPSPLYQPQESIHNHKSERREGVEKHESCGDGDRVLSIEESDTLPPPLLLTNDKGGVGVSGSGGGVISESEGYERLSDELSSSSSPSASSTPPPKLLLIHSHSLDERSKRGSSSLFSSLPPPHSLSLDEPLGGKRGGEEGRRKSSITTDPKEGGICDNPCFGGEEEESGGSSIKSAPDPKSEVPLPRPKGAKRHRVRGRVKHFRPRGSKSGPAARALASYAVSVGHLLLYLPAMFVVGLQGASLPPGVALLCGIVVYCDFLIQPIALLLVSHRLRVEVEATLSSLFVPTKAKAAS